VAIRKSGRVVLSMGLVSTLAACTGAVPQSAPVPVGGPTTLGTYAGSIVIDGQTFGATLTLRAAGSLGAEAAFRVEGMLTIPSPVEIEGEAEGIAIGELLRLSVDYRSVDGCDGRIDGILDVTREGAALDGPVTVEDCGEPVAGRLTLRRQDMAPS
jgi:hypothetical protein